MDNNQLYRDALGRFRADSEERQKKQEQQKLEAQAELLNGAVTMREYIERRETIPHLILQPDIPADEMTMADYIKLRDPHRGYSWTYDDYRQAVIRKD